LKSALVGLGLQRASQYSNDVGGWLPVDQLDAATALGELHAIRAAMPRTRSGAIQTQGDFAQNSDLVRTANALDGTGVTVGVISDSYDCYTQYADNGVPAGGNAGYANNGFNTTATGDAASGDLPSSVNVLEEATCMNYGAPINLPFGDEGRAMMQIIHDVAPGAGFAFYTAETSEADFANGIVKLAASVASGGAGAKVIVDDVGYPDEPFFQDGAVAQAVNAVVAQGVAYFSSAGNNGTLAYDNNAPSFATTGTGKNAGEFLLNFNQGSGAVSTVLPVSIPPLIPGEFVAIVAEWDQPYVTGAPNSGGAKNQIDLCIEGAIGNDIINKLLGQWYRAGANQNRGRGRRPGQHNCSAVRNQQRHAAGTSRRRGRRRRGRGIFCEHTFLRVCPDSRTVFFGRRRSNSVRRDRSPSSNSGVSTKTGFRRSGWRQRYFPRIQAGGRRAYRRQHGHRMSEQLRLSEFLRHLGRCAACGRHRRTAAAGRSLAHTHAALRTPAAERRTDRHGADRYQP
jgi:hypothetical protein